MVINPQPRVTRNTPTGVGKTRSSKGRAGDLQKHPHGRGEDRPTVRTGLNELETPPRAWGRRTARSMRKSDYGNTPTGVGKTRAEAAPTLSAKKHPHGRGEDCNRQPVAACWRETPPRAWGRHESPTTRLAAAGNTPTGVGKTLVAKVPVAASRKHPHGRGEDRF